MNILITYDSAIAGSILSAAIQLKKCPTATVVDVQQLELSDEDLECDVVYHMVPIELDDEDKNNENVHFIEAPEVKKGKNGYMKKRSLLVFEREFPGQTRPIIVHYLGAFQLQERDEDAAEAAKAAIVTYLHDLNDHHVKTHWMSLLAGDRIALEDLVRKGYPIVAYKERFESGTDAMLLDDAIGQVELLESALEKEIQEKKKLKADMKQMVNDSGKIVSDQAKEVKQINDLLNKVQPAALLHAMTPKQAEDYFTVKQLRAMARDIGGVKGYGQANQKTLVTELKKRTKKIFGSNLKEIALN